LSTLGCSVQSSAQAAAETVQSLASSSMPAVRAIGVQMGQVLAQRGDTNSVEAVGALGRRAGALVDAALTCGAIASPRKARRLETALRSAVNVEFGTRHEDDALREYERRTGCRVVESNEELLLWRFPVDETEPPAPVRRVPLRARRPPPPRHRAPPDCACACGCRLFRAIDRCRAALAVERGEVRWWWRLLRTLDAEAEEAHYRRTDAGASGAAPGADGVAAACDALEWDALGLMSDLRVARGRSLLSALRRAARRRQRAQTRLRWLEECLLSDDGRGGGENGEGGGDGGEPSAQLTDYWHGGDRWDMNALRSDLRIELARCRAVCAQLAALGDDDNAAVAEEDSARGGSCLFYLAGAVDGVTDELVPPPQPGAQAAEAAHGAPPLGAAAAPQPDDEGWRVRRVVVEVKHRVGSLKAPPPLYDEIQLVTYCLMLGVTDGDLVQCVRHHGAAAGQTILVTRVSLHAPPMCHGANWHVHLLPRLYAFARLVLRARRCRALRYAYVLGGPAKRRRILADALPHLSAVLVNAS
jgi:hypothetical protein